MQEISKELWISIAVNIITLAFFAGVFFQTQRQLQEAIKEIKSSFETKIKELKEDFLTKLTDLKQNFHEKFERVERKQDKHNNLIERVTLVEASVKSAHKRIDKSERIKDTEDKLS